MPIQSLHLDIDNTLLQIHAHSALTNLGIPPIIPRELQDNGKHHGPIANGYIHQFKNDGTALPPLPLKDIQESTDYKNYYEQRKISLDQALINLFPKDENGRHSDAHNLLKHPNEMKNLIQDALNNDKTVDLTSFTQYPEVGQVILQALGLSDAEIKQINVIGGYPTAGVKSDVRKEEHRRIASNIRNAEYDPTTSLLMDDDDKNTAKAQNSIIAPKAENEGQNNTTVINNIQNNIQFKLAPSKTNTQHFIKARKELALSAQQQTIAPIQSSKPPSPKPPTKRPQTPPDSGLPSPATTRPATPEPNPQPDEGEKFLRRIINSQNINIKNNTNIGNVVHYSIGIDKNIDKEELSKIRNTLIAEGIRAKFNDADNTIVIPRVHLTGPENKKHDSRPQHGNGR